jgi:hypothetical protein
MPNALSNSKMFNPIIASRLEQKTLQATADCFGIKINSDIAIVFLNNYCPISANYNGQFKEVLLGSHEFLQVLSGKLEFETL